jgi:RHS repeat-associated protein
LPTLSVNLSNFNVIVEDTDFVYSGRGPSVALTRTYNADDPRESAFGRSWTFNYDVFLGVNPNGTVDIKRESGKVDHFTPRGDGTYQPPLWVYDELHRNPEGTFRLVLKGSKLTQHFNVQGKLTHITDRHGHAVTLHYAGDWQLQSVTDAVGRVTRFHYTPHGKISAVVDPLGRQATFAYDDNNHLVTNIDMAGTRIEYTYDNMSYMTSITTPQGQMTLHHGTTPHFTEFPSVIKALRDPLGNTTYFDTGASIAWVIDAQGQQTFYFNNDNSETTEITDPLGHKTQFAYTNGNVTRITDANGRFTTLEYDGRGNVTRVNDPLGNTLQFHYDRRDNLLQVVDAAGNTHRFEYDTTDNLTKVFNPNNDALTFTYDRFGQVTGLTDAQQHTTTLSYDNAGNVIRTTHASGGVTAATYDGVGRLASFTDARGSTFHYTYDGLDRLTEMVQPDTSATRYTYGCCSLQSISDASGTLRFEYDQANRLTRFINAKNQRIHYGYDANGNLTTLTYPDGKVVRYIYDAAHRLQTVTDWLGNSTVYNYDAAGNLLSHLNANGTLTGYQYDAGNLLMALINANATGKIIASYRSAFDRQGNRTHMMTFAPPGATPGPQRVTHTYGADNRLQTVNESAFTHDANGNLTVTAGTPPKTYTYDALDRLTQVTFPGYQAQYHYDVLGHRIARTVDGTTTQYIVNPNGAGSQVLAETDGAGNIVAYYVYGLGLISKVTPTGETYVYHYDALGSTVAMTDVSGHVVNTYAYDAFGQVAASAETIANPFKYIGRYGVMDEDNGLLYMRARYYDPLLGRFITQDPIGWLGGMNLYTYVGNNPTNLVDPSGLDWGPEVHKLWKHFVKKATEGTTVIKTVTGEILKRASQAFGGPLAREIAKSHVTLLGRITQAAELYGKFVAVPCLTSPVNQIYKMLKKTPDKLQ